MFIRCSSPRIIRWRHASISHAFGLLTIVVITITALIVRGCAAALVPGRGSPSPKCSRSSSIDGRQRRDGARPYVPIFTLFMFILFGTSFATS
jgi:hypothetical protein